MRDLLASVAAFVAFVGVAAAQTTLPPQDDLNKTPKTGQQVAPAEGAAPISETPIVSSPPSPEARTPANPLQPPPAIEGSPPPASADVPPLPARPAPPTPLR